MALAGLSKQTAKVGAGRGSRTPKTRRSADFESLLFQLTIDNTGHIRKRNMEV